MEGFDERKEGRGENEAREEEKGVKWEDKRGEGNIRIRLEEEEAWRRKTRIGS